MNTLLLVVLLNLAPLPQAAEPAPAAVPPGAASAGAHPQTKKEPLYDESADAKAQIAAALAKAKRDNTRVLIQWGANWCGWCHTLHKLFSTNLEVKQKLLYEYEVVLVDIGDFKNPKNKDLAEKYHADYAAKGVPYLTVLGADGTAIANQETGTLELEQKAEPGDKGWVQAHDPEKVTSFLTRNQASYAKADDLLNVALAKAKEAKKPLLVHFGAPWCGWCNRLDQWLAREDVSKVLDGKLVHVKIDSERTIGGAEMLKRFNPRNAGGIPWSVVVDADGKVLAASDIDGENFGYPGNEKDFGSFRNMLAKAGVTLTDDEAKSLVKSAEELIPKRPTR
jgi:thiol-disulfide isomerase/thioredoxin